MTEINIEIEYETQTTETTELLMKKIISDILKGLTQESQRTYNLVLSEMIKDLIEYWITEAYNIMPESLFRAFQLIKRVGNGNFYYF